jgi:hypothetical protein
MSPLPAAEGAAQDAAGKLMATILRAAQREGRVLRAAILYWIRVSGYVIAGFPDISLPVVQLGKLKSLSAVRFIGSSREFHPSILVLPIVMR